MSDDRDLNFEEMKQAAYEFRSCDDLHNRAFLTLLKLMNDIEKGRVVILEKEPAEDVLVAIEAKGGEWRSDHGLMSRKIYRDIFKAVPEYKLKQYRRQ